MTTRAKKFLILALILFLVFVAGSYAAYQGYKTVRQTRLVNKAKVYLEKSKERNALLCLQRALRYNGNDVEACRLMAQLAEKGSSPAALVWRGKVVQLRPDSLDDRLALAQAALRFRDYTAATNALEGASSKDKQTAAYHNLAGAVASSGRLLAAAEQHFIEAARLEPTNPAPQLNLAIVRLHNTNSPSSAEARSALRALSANLTNGIIACTALRELIADALKNRRFPEALSLSGNLLEKTNSTFSDRVLRLEVLRECNSPDFKPALAEYQRQAGTNGSHIYELAMWHMARRGPSETLLWLQTLPETARTNQPACLIIADGLSRAEKWSVLLSTVKDQNWGDLDFVRHAFSARALRAQQLSAAAKGEWELALKAVNGQLPGLSMLLRLCAVWGFDSEGEELLWMIFNRYPQERWAFYALQQMLYGTGRTRPLLSLLGQQLQREPSNLAVRNNQAVVAMLLEANEFKPHDVALELFTKAPTNATFVSTYAFSLYLQKKPAEALKVIQALPPKDLENPAVAGYYGLLLKEAGDSNRARTYLDWALKSTLLPEEKTLFESAKRGV